MASRTPEGYIEMPELKKGRCFGCVFETDTGCDYPVQKDEKTNCRYTYAIDTPEGIAEHAKYRIGLKS